MTSPNNVADLFHTLSYGVYAVGVSHGGRRNAFTAAWVMQVSFEPLLIAVSVNPGNASYPMLRESGRFTVNVLHEGHLDLARALGTRSARDGDKLDGIRWRTGPVDAPILQDAVAWFSCEVRDNHRAGDHQLVVARVRDGGVLEPDARPLGYAETGEMDGSTELYPETL